MSKFDKKNERMYGNGQGMFGGKKPQPPTRLEPVPERTEPAQYSLRGCGDPNCQSCNPETAAMRGNSPTGRYMGGPPRGGPTGRLDVYSVTDLSGMINMDGVRSIEEQMRRMMGGGFISFSQDGVYVDNVSRPAAPAEPKPSEAYKEAREAVEQWICEAPDVGFDDIIGNDEALQQLKDAIQAPVLHAELYAAYGMTMPKGALLSGPPGCGKTMFAKAAAAELKKLYGTKVEFISISGSELQSMYVGQTEGYITSIFTFAREYQAFHGHPLLVFMDEAEVLLPDRTGRVRRVASWEESQVATFLAEMDGMKINGAFMLLATNRPEVIDQAVLRDGRCDFKITVKRPTQAAIEVILRKNFASTLLADDTTIEQLVFAAVEMIYDPHKILLDWGSMKVMLDLEKHEVSIKQGVHRHFLFEHIISGAMAVSVPQRAKRYAFTRDKADGVARGVTVTDVVNSVNDLFNENKGLEHQFALEEFKADFMAELDAGD